MSFDSFKSSTVGPEALAARLEHEKRLREQRERDRANRQRDKERREYNLQVAMEDSKNYETPELGEVPAIAGVIPRLSRGGISAAPVNIKTTIASNNVPNANPAAPKAETGFRLKRF